MLYLINSVTFFALASIWSKSNWGNFLLKLGFIVLGVANIVTYMEK